MGQHLANWKEKDSRSLFCNLQGDFAPKITSASACILRRVAFWHIHSTAGVKRALTLQTCFVTEGSLSL